MKWAALLVLLAALPLHAERRYVIAHYEVHIAPDLAAQRLNGIEIIRFRVPDSPIELDAGALRILSVRSHGRRVRFQRRDRLLVIPGHHLSLTIRYQAGPAKGLVFFPDQVYSSFFTSDWMVCDDRPEDRSTLALTVDAPGLAVESSGRLETPTPSFLFAFAAGRFSLSQSRGLRVRGAGAEILEPTAAAMRFLEEKSGKPFPRPVYTQVFTAGKVEQEAAYFTLLPKSYAEGLAKDPTDLWLLAHELAHQWYGVGIPCRDWSDFWLSEGMATYLADAFLGARYGAERFEREIARSRQIYEDLKQQGKDRPLSFHGWTTPQQAGGSLPYHKGAWVLEQLRQEIGDKPFWRGLQLYTEHYWSVPVTSAEFQKSMQESAGRDLSDFFTRWVYR